MTPPKLFSNLPYQIQERKVIGETQDLRAQEMILAPGDVIPWHYHSRVTDTFYCIAGELKIETPAPGEEVFLKPGDSLVVPSPQAHQVSNGGEKVCRFVLIQGVGPYDFIPVRP